MMQKINLWLPGDKGGRHKLEDWNWHIPFTIYKTTYKIDI